MDPYLPRRMSSANPFASLFRGMSQDLEHAEPPEPTLNDQLQDIFSFTLNEKATLTKEVSPVYGFAQKINTATQVKAIFCKQSCSRFCTWRMHKKTWALQS